jgi:hypothetical protein
MLEPITVPSIAMKYCSRFKNRRTRAKKIVGICTRNPIPSAIPIKLNPSNLDHEN